MTRSGFPTERGAAIAARVGVLGFWILLSAICIACGDASPPQGMSGQAPQPQLETQPATPYPQRSTPYPLLVGNLLWNPGFEQEYEGWRESKLISSFRVVEVPVRSGRYSAHFAIHWQPGDREVANRVLAAVQERSPTRFPDRMGGWYRVEAWENESAETRCYLQAVVIVQDDPRAHELVYPGEPERNPELVNYQIRYPLVGLTEPLGPVENARVKEVRMGPPPLGEWIHFDLPIRNDFEALWGVVPSDYAFLRVFFEARWDGKEEGAALRADVYFDDLFFGFEDLPNP